MSEQQTGISGIAVNTEVKEKNDKFVGTKIPTSTYQELQELGLKEERSVSWLIGKAIKEKLAREA